jgi:hypothetical protein
VFPFGIGLDSIDFFGAGKAKAHLFTGLNHMGQPCVRRFVLKSSVLGSVWFGHGRFSLVKKFDLVFADQLNVGVSVESTICKKHGNICNIVRVFNQPLQLVLGQVIDHCKSLVLGHAQLLKG